MDSLGTARISSHRLRVFDSSPEGRLVTIDWLHERLDGSLQSMIVWGHTLDEVWRRAYHLQDEQLAAERGIKELP
jgi:hypothetical protein